MIKKTIQMNKKKEGNQLAQTTYVVHIQALCTKNIIYLTERNIKNW